MKWIVYQPTPWLFMPSSTSSVQLDMWAPSPEFGSLWQRDSWGRLHTVLPVVNIPSLNLQRPSRSRSSWRQLQWGLGWRGSSSWQMSNKIGPFWPARSQWSMKLVSKFSWSLQIDLNIYFQMIWLFSSLPMSHTTTGLLMGTNAWQSMSSKHLHLMYWQTQFRISDLIQWRDGGSLG